MKKIQLLLFVCFFICLMLSGSIPAFSAILELYPTFHSMGVVVHLENEEDPDVDASVAITYCSPGDECRQGFPPTRVNLNRFVGSLFFLKPGTLYNVTVELTDAEGTLEGVILKGSAATKTEPRAISPSHSYFASPFGNGNACTIQQPCSFQSALGAVQAGQEIVLTAGVYYAGEIGFPRSGTEQAPIIIRGQNGAEAIFDGSDPQIFNWVHIGENTFSATVNGMDTHLVAENGQRLYPYNSLADLQSLTWGISGFYVDGDQVWLKFEDGHAPINEEITVSRYNTAFTVERNYLHFSNLTFRYYGRGFYGKALYFNNASHNIVDHCSFQVNDLGIGVKRDSNRNLFQYNEFSDTIFMWPWSGVKDGSRLETGGIRFYSPTTGRGNIIRYNAFYNFFDGFGACPTEAGEETNETDVYDNYVHHVGDDGMETDGTCSNVRIWNNTFHDVLVGISLAPVYEGPVYTISNLIYRAGAGNSEYTGYPFKFNSGYGKSGQIFLFHNTADAVLPGNNGMYIKAPGSWKMLIAKNNIWLGTRYAMENFNTDQPVDFDYNNLWTPQSVLVRWDSVRYTTLVQFTAATGQEVHSLNSPVSFVDSPIGDYRLTAGNDAIDAGIHIPGINDRFYGAAPDMGAFEYIPGCQWDYDDDNDVDGLDLTNFSLQFVEGNLEGFSAKFGSTDC